MTLRGRNAQEGRRQAVIPMAFRRAGTQTAGPIMAIKSKNPTRRTIKLLGAGVRTLGRSVLNRLPLGNEIERSARHWEQVGKDWVNTLGELRGAAMKMGQLASQYADVLPPALAEQLRKLQRSAEPLPYAQIKAVLDAAWTPAQWAQVAEINPVALAAASIGQVHRGVLRDGTPVVVKVRYPGVREAVDADLVQLRRLLVASRLLPIDPASIDLLLREVRQRLRDETDYVTELHYLETLRAACAVEGVRYPTPRPELCADSVLVMSEETGESLETAATWKVAVRDHLGAILGRWLCHSFFTGRAVHADPHPGNFAFREDGTVVVYDMGCVKRVPETVVARVRELLIHARNHDWPALHATLVALEGVRPDVKVEDVEAVYREVVALTLDRICTAERFDFSDPAFIDDLRAAGRRHLAAAFKFQPVSELAFVMRAVSGLYWMLRTLRARVAVRALFEQYCG